MDNNKTMKKLILTVSIFLLVGIGNSYAQCSPDQYTNQCIPKMGEGFNFLKAYRLDGKSGSVPEFQYSHLFTKGNQYMINLCASGEQTDGLVVTLYDSRKQQIATSFVDGKYIKGLIFPCKATGIYYISYTYKDSDNYCGGSVMGFKKS